MVLCLLSRGSRGHWTKLNHEETVRGPEIAIFPEKSEILLEVLTNKSPPGSQVHSLTPLFTSTVRRRCRGRRRRRRARDSARSV